MTTLSEQSEAETGGGSLVDLRSVGTSLVTGGLVAAFTVLLTLWATNQQREAEIDQISDRLEKMSTSLDTLEDTIHERATVDQLHKVSSKAEADATQRAKSYTDSQVSELQPVLTRLTVVLERIDEDRKEAKADRRLIHKELQELQQSIGRR